MASTKAVAEPNMAMIHIQKTAPGPPMKMAEATPARLPVPTRLESDTAKAWNELMVFEPSALWVDEVECLKRCIISRSMENCAPRMRIVK